MIISQESIDRIQTRSVIKGVHEMYVILIVRPLDLSTYTCTAQPSTFNTCKPSTKLGLFCHNTSFHPGDAFCD